MRRMGREQLMERIERECGACDRHFMRIKESMACLGLTLPISRSQYDNLTENQVRCIDQFLFRFAKAQDSIGAKIFRYLMALMEEETDSVPMRDVLDKMERYGVIDSADEWIYIRELRNDISHEYTTMGHDEVELLNELIGKASELERIYNRAKAKMAEYGRSGRGLF